MNAKWLNAMYDLSVHFILHANEDCVIAFRYVLALLSLLLSGRLPVYKVLPCAKFLTISWPIISPDMCISKLLSFRIDWFCYSNKYSVRGLANGSGVGITSRAGSDNENSRRI